MPVVVIVATVSVIFPAFGLVLYLGLGTAGVVAAWAAAVLSVFVLMFAKYGCAKRFDRLNDKAYLSTNEA